MTAVIKQSEIPSCDDCDMYCPDTMRCSLIYSLRNIRDWNAGLYPENCAYLERKSQK